MASTAANGVNRTPKTNLSVASLINCSTKVSTASLDKVKSETITSAAITNGPKNLPTVANSDLLYKSVSSSGQLPPPLAPTSPVTATLTVNYTLQQYSDLVAGFRSSSSGNPLSNIKTLTNVVTNPLSKIEVNHQYSPKKPYVEIRPAPIAQANHINSSLLAPGKNSKLNLTPDNNIGLMTATNKPPLVVLSTTSIVPSTIISSSATRLKTIVAKPTPQAIQKLQVPSDIKSVIVPRGWNRILEKDYITYVSPNKSRLRSMEDLLYYLQQDGTCKCGLKCPFKPSEVFDFNPKVQSRFGFSANGKVDVERENHCNVCRKFEELFPLAPKSKPGKGRKPGVKNKRPLISEDGKPSQERKKILLTGASPLELFQTKMSMGTSSSSFMMNFRAREENNQTSTYTNISPQNSEDDKKTPLDLAAEQIISADLKRQMKSKGRGRGRGRGGLQQQDPSQKNVLKKAIPNATVHNARDIQLKEILNEVTNPIAGDVTTPKHILISQLQGLLSGHCKPDLNEISQALSTLQNKQASLSLSGICETQTTSILHSLEMKTNDAIKQDIVSGNNLLPNLPTKPSILNIQSKVNQSKSSINVDVQNMSQSTAVKNNSAAQQQQQQQMLLLQLVSQGQPVISNASVNANNGQAVSGTQQPQKILISTPQSSPASILHQKTSPISLPLQYVVRQSPTLTLHQPIVHYVTHTAPYVDSPNNKSTSTTSYVKIAPAVVPNARIERVNPLLEEQQKQERALLESMQEHLHEKNLNSEKVYQTLPEAGKFLSTVASQHYEENIDKKDANIEDDSLTNNDELLLHCDESVSDREENSIKLNSSNGVVWVHLPGFPMWPGKIMRYDEVKKPKLDDGEVYILMYLTKQIHAVTEAQLKPFDLKLAKEEWDTSGKEDMKSNSDLEKAIREAMLDAAM